MDRDFYIISSNEQESEPAKQIVGTKDDDLPVRDAAFKVLHVGSFFFFFFFSTMILIISCISCLDKTVKKEVWIDPICNIK